MSGKRTNNTTPEETPFLQEFLESEGGELEAHHRHLPWSPRERHGGSKKKESKASLTDFVIGFFVGNKSDSAQ